MTGSVLPCLWPSLLGFGYRCSSPLLSASCFSASPAAARSSLLWLRFALCLRFFLHSALLTTVFLPLLVDWRLLGLGATVHATVGPRRLSCLNRSLRVLAALFFAIRFASF